MSVGLEEVPINDLKPPAQGVELPESVTDNLPARFENEMMSQGSCFFNLIVTGQKSL